VARFIQTRLRGVKMPLLVPAGALPRKSVDVVVPVAFHMSQAEHRSQRQILLHRKPGLHGQILARKKIVRWAAGIPLRAARRVEERPGVRVLPVLRYPFKIFYRILEDRVEILHIHHAARDLPGPDL
jgi:hypothetical protein